MLAVAVCGAIAPPPEVRAAPTADPARLSRELAAPWPALQDPSGHLYDALQPDGSSRYGDAMAGLGTLQTGIRERDGRLVRVGLRALGAATRRVDPWFATRPFEVWAVAASYNLVKRRLRAGRLRRRALRRWSQWLRAQKTTVLQRGGYDNKYLVDAVAVLEAQRTGVRSRAGGTILGGGREAARRRALRLLNRQIPARARASDLILSDPEANPPAYHALSYSFYARATTLLGRRAPRANKAVLREMGRVTEQIVAPDGDVAYWGRSSQQNWTLSAAAYGLMATAAMPGTSAADRYRYYTLAGRLLTRLRSYGVGPRGEWLTPSLRQDFATGRRGIDAYARATEYTGLALVNLNWVERLLRTPPPIVASAVQAQAIVGQGTGRFVVVRAGNLWYAVKQRSDGELGVADLRYDFGLVAFKRFEAGAWRDVIPLRPMGSGSAGPVLLTAKGAAMPTGESIVASEDDGTVLIRGGFRYSDGTWERADAEFTIRPTANRSCLEVAVEARPGERYEFSTFARGNVTSDPGSGRIAASDRPASFNLPIESSRAEPGYSSASDARLTRQRFVVRSPARQPVSMTVC